MKRKKLTREEESQLLDECIEKSDCGKLAQHYQGLVHHIVEKTLARSSANYNWDDIENLCQDVFEELFKGGLKNLRRYDKTGRSLSRWIARLAYWTVVKFLRKKGSPLSYGEISEKIPDDKGNMEKRTEARQILERMYKNCMIRLSDQEKKVIELAIIDGLSNKEVAEILKIKTGNVYTVKSRALRKLKECMEEL